MTGGTEMQQAIPVPVAWPRAGGAYPGVNRLGGGGVHQIRARLRHGGAAGQNRALPRPDAPGYLMRPGRLPPHAAGGDRSIYRQITGAFHNDG